MVYRYDGAAAFAQLRKWEKYEPVPEPHTSWLTIIFEENDKTVGDLVQLLLFVSSAADIPVLCKLPSLLHYDWEMIHGMSEKQIRKLKHVFCSYESIDEDIPCFFSEDSCLKVILASDVAVKLLKVQRRQLRVTGNMEKHIAKQLMHARDDEKKPRTRYDYDALRKLSGEFEAESTCSDVVRVGSRIRSEIGSLELCMRFMSLLYGALSSEHSCLF